MMRLHVHQMRGLSSYCKVSYSVCLGLLVPDRALHIVHHHYCVAMVVAVCVHTYMYLNVVYTVCMCTIGK